MNTPDVVVIGMGFTGLPTAVAAANAGLSVVGLDSSPQRLRQIVEAEPGHGLGTASESDVCARMSDGRLRVRSTKHGVPRAQTYLVCVPTPPDHRGGLDLDALTRAVNSVGDVLGRGDLVVVQSTCPPGTVADLLVPLLESRSGLRAGVEFHVACAPVRIDPGRQSHAFEEVPRVVGGFTPKCTRRAVWFLSQVTRNVVEVGTCHAAELVKIFENTFRMVNISLANELAALCRSYRVSVSEVLRAAGTKPFGFLGHLPSAGAGGDCVPVSARFFSLCARRQGLLSPVVDAALAVNDAMPAHTVHRVRDALRVLGKSARHSRVLVVGITYKADVVNIRQSAAVSVIEELRREADVGYHDPYIPNLPLINGATLASIPLDDVDWHSLDAVLVMTKHRVIDYPALVARGVPTFDCSTGDPEPMDAPSAATAKSA